MNTNYNDRYKKLILESPRYLSCQPGYFTEKLNYREVYVSKENSLYDVISMFYEASAYDAEISIPVIPDGCVDLVVSFKEGEFVGISVCGTISTMYSMRVSNSDYIFGMRFTPGKFTEGFTDIEEIIDNQKDMRILSAENTFIKELAASSDFSERVKAACRYVEKISFQKKSKNFLVRCAMDYICESGGNVSINKLSQELIYSTKHIEEIFKEYTGFTPKYMGRLVRAHRAVMMLLWSGQYSKTDISMACGYSDLSHMNREIKRIMGISTGAVNNVDFYNEDIKHIHIVYNF